MNFNSIFEELTQLYESAEEQKERTVDTKSKLQDETAENGETSVNRENRNEVTPETERELDPRKDVLSEGASDDTDDVGGLDDEDVEIEIVDDEEAAAPVAVQQVLECAKCGALVIKDEADVAIDEETGLANASEACQYCEAEEGYKVIGTFTPAVADVTDGDAEGEEDEDSEDAEDLDELFDASINVDATNAGGHGNDVSVLGRSLPEGCSKDKDLDELFDASVNIDAHEFGGTGNNVSVLGTSLPEELEELEEYYDEEAPGGRNASYSNQRGVGVDCWNQKKSNQWYANRRADQEMNRDLTKYGAKPYNR